MKQETVIHEEVMQYTFKMMEHMTPEQQEALCKCSKNVFDYN